MMDSTIVRKTITKVALSKQCQEKAKILANLRSKNGKIVVKKEELVPEIITPINIETKANKPSKPSTSGSAPFPKALRYPGAYLELPEMPIYQASFEEFKDPFALIQNLNKRGYSKFGCVKVRPPIGWNFEFSFNPKNKKLTTRKQIIKCLSEGKPFEENTHAHTLEEFEEFADKFAANHQYKAPFNFPNAYRKNEYEYWAMVEDPLFQDEHIEVEYAADLPSYKFGSGFPTVYGGRMTDELDADDVSTHPFNFNNLSRAKDSMFQITTRKNETISGISSPWMYAGMLFASFCWHVEDLYMYAANYMHKGAAKTWYCVPSEYKEAFDSLIKEKYGELFIKDPNLLYEITLTMNPLELVKRNIPVYRTEQEPGDFIIAFPKVYHAGVSHGFNISEAVNLAIPEWIPWAKQAMQDYARDGFFKKCTFPYEWLIVENIRRLKELEFSEESMKQLMAEFEELKQKELNNRDIVTKCYKKVAVKHFDNFNQRYDAHVCGTCSNYTFMSYLSCMKCEKKGCTHHITICGCLNPKMVLNVRFTDKELNADLQDL